jgi:hypothetical protein
LRLQSVLSLVTSCLGTHLQRRRLRVIDRQWFVIDHADSYSGSQERLCMMVALDGMWKLPGRMNGRRRGPGEPGHMRLHCTDPPSQTRSVMYWAMDMAITWNSFLLQFKFNDLSINLLLNFNTVKTCLFRRTPITVILSRSCRRSSSR